MTSARTPGVVTFGTEEIRRQSRSKFLLLMKLLLVPFLALMGFGSGAMLRDAGLPRAVCVAGSMLLGLGLPWYALRVINRRRRCWFELRPEGVACGPGKFGWVAPYDEVSLIQQSHVQDVQEPFLEVTAGARSAHVLMNAETARACARALADRCPCAIRIDETGHEHPPVVLQTDPGSTLAGKAIHNLGLLRSRYLLVTRMLVACCLVSVAVLTFVGLARLGVIQADPGLIRGLTISSLFFTGVFGVAGLLQFGQYRSWDRYCRTFTEGAEDTSHGA